ncbi:MAG: leucyl aminopeptidase [Simkaniaceae bacterium]
MKVSQLSGFNKKSKADVVIVPFWQGKTKAEMAAAFKEYEVLLLTPVKSKDFQGKLGETSLLYTSSSMQKRVMLLGLGEEKKADLEQIRRAYSFAVKLCRKKSWTSCMAILPKIKKRSSLDVCRAMVEGISLANYSFDLKRAEEKKVPYLEKLTIAGVGSEASNVIQKTLHIVEGVNFARDLVNGNADDINPQTVSEKALKLAKEHSKLKVTVLDRKKIEKENMGLLLAVSRGSFRDPAMVVIEYRGAPKTQDLTMVVGKGVTFDTGGLNLKPTGKMETMKGDMAGAGAVLGLLKAAALLSLKANIVGIVPLAENSIDAKSYKPGDVYPSYLGKTVEIINTDAEGRLVLADALAYGQATFHPSRIIDLATLTGAIGIAVGDQRTGMFSNDSALSDILMEAGDATGEKLWPFPMDEEYYEGLKSNIADLKNATTDRMAGSIVGAKFLEAFIKDVPWAHLDIGFTGYLDHPKYYHPTSGSGVGIRMLIEAIERLYEK